MTLKTIYQYNPTSAKLKEELSLKSDQDTPPNPIKNYESQKHKRET